MKNLRERVKNPRAKKGCLACYAVGAAAPAFAYVDVAYVPLSLCKDKVAIVKEVGICFKHAGRKAGILDPEVGKWNKTPYGYMPERDGMYALIGGRENTQVIMGACRRSIPLWW